MECGTDEQGDSDAAARSEDALCLEQVEPEADPREPVLTVTAQSGDWIRKVVEDDDEAAAVTQVLCACLASLVQQVGCHDPPPPLFIPLLEGIACLP